MQGDADPEFPAGQSEQLVNVMRSRGVKVWHLRAAEEAALFRSKHADGAYRLSLAQFLDSPP